MAAFTRTFLAFFFILNQCGYQECSENISSCFPTNSMVNCHKSARYLLLHWFQMFPYAYLPEGGSSPRGIIIDVAKTLLDRCCPSCWQINETSPVDSAQFYRSEPKYIGISLPYRMSAADHHYRQNYVPVITDPTSALVKKRQNWNIAVKNLMLTIHDAWPVLITALLFSWISGMVIWFLEMWWNDEHFPKKFLRGSWEGFWWAFVSMTTVGYGDRSPRTFLGRVYAVLWILVGLCLCSIFTATLTSALTMHVVDDQLIITRKKIGVIPNSVEAIIALQNQADIRYYNTTDELLHAVLDNEVNGILLDYYFAMVYEAILAHDGLIIANVLKAKDLSLGIKLISQDLATCMRDEYYKDYANILHRAISNESTSEPMRMISKSQLSGIFDPNGVMFKTILYVCVAVACSMFFIGVCLDVFCRKRRKIGLNFNKVKRMNYGDSELLSDLQNLIMTWKERQARARTEVFSMLESEA